MDQEELTGLVLEATDGLMTSMQLLVMSMSQTDGRFDRDHYSRLVAQYRSEQVADDTFQASVLDRMLAFLVQEPDVLRRRMLMRVVPESNPGDGPTPGGAAPKQ